jgi:ATP-binding cassette subfamily B protein
MTAEFYENEEMTEQERDMTFGQAFRALVPYIKTHRKRLFICLLLLFGTTAMSLAWPWLVQQAIDGPLTEQLSRDVAERTFMPLVAFGVAILLIQASNLVFQYFQRIKLETVGQDIMLDLRQNLFRHILQQDISFFDNHPVGRLMARVESDTESLRQLFTNTVVLVVGDLVLILGIWGVMIYSEWRLGLLVFGLFPIVVGLVYIFHKITTHRFLEVRKRMAEVTATLTEFLHGMSIVQIFHRGDYARSRVYRACERKFSEDSFVNIAVCVFFNTLFFIEYVKIGMVLFLGVMWGITPGTIVLFILLIWREFDPIARTADQLGSFQKGIAGARRIFSLLRVQPRLNPPEKPAPWDGLKEGIRFEHVWFSYTDDEDWVLRDVSFEIPVGSRVALAGVTGGGKSTIISLLLRMYDPQRGRILVDGIDIRELDLEKLRRSFALVLQDIILFPGSVEANIGLDVEGLSREQIVAASRTVAADRFISRLPNKYDTEVSEKGSNFSRGERQLLSFARALVVNPDLLILDEATSSVDPETERTIQASLKRLMKGRTSLIIAHRLSTILDVDQILVIRRGEIVERGTHTELLLQNGYYSKLFHLQFKHANGEMSRVK